MNITENTSRMPKILKSSDISRLLEVSPDDITLLARRGYLRGFKSGRQWRFKKRYILSWLKNHSMDDILSLIKAR